jgi:hypothetical protein
MNSTETFDAGTPQQAAKKLERWKIALAVGGLLAMGPVIALILGVLVAFSLPALVLALPFLAVAWVHEPVQGPTAPLAPRRRMPLGGPAPSPV